MKKTGILIVCFLLMFFIGKVIVMRKKIVFSVLFLLFAFMINNQYTVLAMDTGFETTIHNLRVRARSTKKK